MFKLRSLATAALTAALFISSFTAGMAAAAELTSSDSAACVTAEATTDTEVERLAIDEANRVAATLPQVCDLAWDFFDGKTDAYIAAAGLAQNTVHFDVTPATEGADLELIVRSAVRHELGHFAVYWAGAEDQLAAFDTVTTRNTTHDYDTGSEVIADAIGQVLAGDADHYTFYADMTTAALATADEIVNSLR